MTGPKTYAQTPPRKIGTLIHISICFCGHRTADHDSPIDAEAELDEHMKECDDINTIKWLRATKEEGE